MEKKNVVWEKLSLFVLSVTVLAVILFWGFNQQMNDKSTVQSFDGQHLYDEITTSELEILINDIPLELDLTKLHQVATPKLLSTEINNRISFTTNNKTEVYINGEKIDENTTFMVDELSPLNNLELMIKNGKQVRYVELKTLPEDFPTLQFTGYSTSEGDFYGDLLNDESNSFIFKMSSAGDLLFYFTEFNEHGSLMNFQKHNVNGEVYYSYFNPSENFKDHLPFTGIEYGAIDIMDSEYHVINSLELLPSEKLPQGGYVENHDFIMIDKNHYLLTGAVDRNVYMDDLGTYTRVKAAYIQEIKEGEVIFEWDSSDHPELFAQSVENNDYLNVNEYFYAADYAHINSINIDPVDNNLVISFRNLDEVIKIGRDTGDIHWILGGVGDMFGLEDSQKFSRQHYAKYTKDGTILLFDNGNANEKTRVLEFTLNESDLYLEDFKEYVVEGKYSMATGSAMKTESDTIVIGWGLGSYHSLMSELDINTNKIISEIIPPVEQYSYRVVKFK